MDGIDVWLHVHVILMWLLRNGLSRLGKIKRLDAIKRRESSWVRNVLRHTPLTKIVLWRCRCKVVRLWVVVWLCQKIWLSRKFSFVTLSNIWKVPRWRKDRLRVPILTDISGWSRYTVSDTAMFWRHAPTWLRVFVLENLTLCQILRKEYIWTLRMGICTCWMTKYWLIEVEVVRTASRRFG